MDARETLYAAADDMAKYGQAKRQFFKPNIGDNLTEPQPEGWWKTAPSCAMGSMGRVTGKVTAGGVVANEEAIAPAVHRLAAFIRNSELVGPDLSFLDDFSIVASYNDRDTTTAEDMVLAMKRAAGE